MGVCASNNSASKADIDKDRKIMKQLIDEKRKLENEFKLLLLGAGESGKSTIAKQMRIIHLGGFNEEERTGYKSIIYNNTVASMRVLVTATEELDLTIEEANREAADRISNGDEYFSGEILSKKLASDIKQCWSDKGIKEAYDRSAEFQLNDSAGYYFDNIDRLATSDFVPTVEDVLRSRAKTTGIIETEFEHDGLRFRLVDVGGQRSERKKWMHCFQDVTAVLFVVALSEYNLRLYEDDVTNRLQESLRLFQEVCNNRWFTETATLLFLNKEDLFREKIKTIPISAAFPDYSGGNDYESCIDFITKEFVGRNENPKKTIYPHVTCATNTENIRVVFTAVKDTIIKQAVVESDLGI